MSDAIQSASEGGSETYRLDCGASATPSTTLVMAIASVIGVEPTDMHPLHYAVDVDALDAHVGGRDRGGELSFDFHGHHVTVRGDGHVEFRPLDGPGR